MSNATLSLATTSTSRPLFLHRLHAPSSCIDFTSPLPASSRTPECYKQNWIRGNRVDMHILYDPERGDGSVQECVLVAQLKEPRTKERQTRVIRVSALDGADCRELHQIRSKVIGRAVWVQGYLIFIRGRVI